MTPPIRRAGLSSDGSDALPERLAGLSLLERHLFLLRRAGVRQVRVETDRPARTLRLPPGLELWWRTDPDEPSAREPCLRVSSRHLLRLQTLQAAASGRLPRGNYQDDAGETVLEISTPPGEPQKAHRLPRGSWTRVGTPLERAQAMRWLLAGVRKDSDGLMARIFDRGLSLSVTRILLDTRIRPNHMTLASTAVGLLGAAQYLFPTRSHELAAACLIWLHTVLDGCDGELARLTFRESRLGALLDFWGDNAVHLALFAGLAYHLRAAEPWAGLLGLSACAGTFGAAWLSDVQPLRRGRTRPPHVDSGGFGGALRRLELLLAQRDFVYLLLFCAFAGTMTGFLWAAGIGAPVYFLIVLALRIRERVSSAPAAGPQTASSQRPQEGLHRGASGVLHP